MITNIGLISLGCAKNLTDTETMIGLLEDRGYTVHGEGSNMSKMDAILINTCGFINDAKEESISQIFDAVSLREENKDLKIIVAGCLVQRYADELFEEITEVDGFLGTTGYHHIIDMIKAIDRGEGRQKAVFDINDDVPDGLPRRRITPSHYAYLKISDGCSNACTYCIIPKIRGRHRSRSQEEILKEATALIQEGANELILVGQDLTQYGVEDGGGGRNLPELLQNLCALEGDFKIRLIYCYPHGISDELIQTIKREEKILKYIDIPIQHISSTVLKRMGRKGLKTDVRAVILKLKKEIPEICIRSTVIVGFPGETSEEFAELKEFVKEGHIDRLGVFRYSKEDGTPAHDMIPQVSSSDKRSRLDQIMRAQQKVSLKLNKTFINALMDVTVEEVDPINHEAVGRTYRDMPQIDGTVLFRYFSNLKPGDRTKVRIYGALEYDLTGVEEI